MSLYALARYNTAPDVVKFACKNGISENPLYLQCDKCGNFACDVRYEFETGLRLRPDEFFPADSDSTQVE